MNNTNRREFIKAGIAAGTGLTLSQVKPEKSLAETTAETETIAVKFRVLGLDGEVKLEVEGKAPENISFKISFDNLSPQKALVHISFKPRKNMAIKRFSIRVAIPLIDVHRIWYTQQIEALGWSTYISLPWRFELDAAGHEGSFLAEVQNRYGKNRGLVALKDQTGDGSLQFGTAYGKSLINVTINRFTPGTTYRADEIDETVYLDFEDISWFDAVSRFVEWYDKEWGLTYNTPRHCYEPAWNTWYPSLGKMNDAFIERTARKCVELGFKTYEIDAGWFIDNCDFEPNPDVFPDLRKTIQKIHSLGLKVIIWYRPFYIQDHFPAVKELGKYRTVVDGKPTTALCARCKEIQERAGLIAGKLMEEYDVDGLKIDHLDSSSIGAPLEYCEANHKHTHDFISDGSREIMRIMAEAIRKVKPDALIEYRLGYSNIANRPFANLYRGQDAPDDPDLVRRHLTMIRSWCRGVAPHNDYGYWSPEESDENVARFLAVLVLYGVPTLSIDFDKLPESHVSIIKAWISFYHEHKENFINGRFEPLSNDFHYSVARISSPDHTFIPVFLKNWPSTLPVQSGCTDTIFIFNGTNRPQIFTMIEGIKGSYKMTATDTMLRPAGKSSTLYSKKGSLILDNPVDIGGIVKLEKI